MTWIKSQLSALLLVASALLPGIHSAYVHDVNGDIVGTGRNYKLKCSHGYMKLAYNSDTWEYVNTSTGQDLVVKFCKPHDCSRGQPVFDTDAYHWYTQKPRDSSYAVISYNAIGEDWWVATRSAAFASSIKIEGDRNKYNIQQDGFWWTQENKSIYLSLRSKNIGEMAVCSFVPAGEDLAFRDQRGLYIQ
ncbi:hypothetical protein BGZ81_006652 [Podila clonocystis]|nr:hypothetical protein BGZ81_006652 [Podila clonocystis]